MNRRENIYKRMISASAAIVTAVCCIPVDFSAGAALLGDADGNGIVDAADASLILEHYAAVSTGHEAVLSGEQSISADVSGDGTADPTDASDVLEYYAYISTHSYISLVDYKAEEIAHIDEPYCCAAAVKCLDTGRILYADNTGAQIAPASLTKLLTASVALNFLSPDTMVTVGTELSLVKPYSSLCLIKQGNRMKLSDLLTGMLMASGNDAAYTVAAVTARAVSQEALTDEEAVAYFADLMNSYAASIGMTDSHFVNPEGWDDPEQYTTLSDLMILAEHAFSVPVIREITGTYRKQVVFDSGEVMNWTNTNALLNPDSIYYCPDAAGMKTGTTAAAGHCLIAAFTKNEKTYIAAVTGCGSDAERFGMALKLWQECP